jgi:aryl-alcohol dehydrogenase-like predicted oxidoreductase
MGAVATGGERPIVGATQAPQLGDSLAAAELELTADEVTRLEQACVPHAIRGHI